MASTPTDSRPSGLPAALGAYTIWGFLPLYLILVQRVPAFEFVGWRVIWTLPFCLLILAVRNQFPAFWRALRNPRTLSLLTLNAALIGANWLIYIWAIQQEQVYAASLGYYLNPLINVLLGTLFLSERLTRLQWFAVAVASCAVALLLSGAITTLWISLSLALTFAFYGMVRKQVDVGSLPGLTIETVILMPPAVGIAVWYSQSATGSSFGGDMWLSSVIVLSGVVTATPLLLFAIAARRMAYSTLGFIQYLAPSIVFILGLTVFQQELKPIQLASFVLIWTAIAIFVADALRRTRGISAAAN